MKSGESTRFSGQRVCILVFIHCFAAFARKLNYQAIIEFPSEFLNRLSVDSCCAPGKETSFCSTFPSFGWQEQIERSSGIIYRNCTSNEQELVHRTPERGCRFEAVKNVLSGCRGRIPIAKVGPVPSILGRTARANGSNCRPDKRYSQSGPDQNRPCVPCRVRECPLRGGHARTRHARDHTFFVRTGTAKRHNLRRTHTYATHVTIVRPACVWCRGDAVGCCIFVWEVFPGDPRDICRAACLPGHPWLFAAPSDQSKA